MKAQATSIVKLRDMAKETRAMLGLSQDQPVSMAKIYDFASLRIDGFEYEVKDNDDPCFQYGDEAFYDINLKKIVVKEYVFKEACNHPSSRSQYTLAHEFGHSIPSNVFHLKLCRENKKEKIPPYEDPEWQADTFAAEFLMPFDECIKMSPEEISLRFGVSKECSEVRKEKVMKEVGKRKVNCK